MTKPFTICIIDDDEIHQFAVSRLSTFNQIAGKILSFPDGEEAIHYLRAHKSEADALPDVILLDLNMPIMDGEMFLDVYSELKPELVIKPDIYMMSSSIFYMEEKTPVMHKEVKDFLVKPIGLAQLQALREKS